MSPRDLILLVILQTFWAGSYAAIKIALEEVPLSALIVFRYGIAALVLLLVTTVSRKHAPIPKQNWLFIVLIGVSVYIGAPLLAFKGIGWTQSLDVSVLVSLEPLATACLAAIFLGERLDREKRIAIGIAVVGVLLLSEVHQLGLGEMSALRLVGNALFLLSLFCEASYTVWGRRITQNGSPLALSTYAMTVGAAIYILFGGYTAMNDLPESLSWKAWAAIGYLSIICSAFGYTTWFFLVKRIPANTIALSLYLQPIIGSLIGYLFMGEDLNLIGFMGMGLIFVGVTIGLFGLNGTRLAKLRACRDS